MEKKAFIILCILSARTTPAESSSTTPAANTSSTSSFTTSAHTASVLLELRCSETFIPELNDSSSQAFKDRAKHVKDNLETIYKWKYPSFIRAHVLSFRPGSVITDIELMFNSIPPNETLLADLANGPNMSSVSVTAVTIHAAEPVTLPGSSNTSASKVPTSTTPSSAAFHTTQSSTTPTTASTNNATSTTTGSSKATSTLAGSSTASTFTASASKSISPTSAAFHNTTKPSTTKETSTTTASQPTASTLISAGSVSPASASSTLSMNKTSTTTESSKATPTLASFNTTTPQTILSSTALKSTAVSVTNTSTTSEGPTTKVPTVPEIVTDLEFHSSDTFTSALDNSESQEFKNRSKLVTDQLEAVYKPKYDNFLRATVQGFRQGSIITTAKLVFSSNQPVPSRKEISDTLLKAVETGNINPLNIISQTISVNGSNFVAPATPATETTASRASKIELHLLQATCLIIMAKLSRLFL